MYNRGSVSIFAVIAGLLIFIAFAGVVVYCCCFRRAQPTAQPFFQSRIMSQRLNLRRQLFYCHDVGAGWVFGTRIVPVLHSAV